MKISNTSTRLKKIMTDNNMRQVDILKRGAILSGI